MEKITRPGERPNAEHASKPVTAQAETGSDANAQTPDQPGTSDATASPDAVAFCPECFYDLRGTQRNACPECGQTLDLDQLRRGLIPWAQRHEIGRLRGFFRTAWQVTFRPRQLCYAVARPVSYRDARRFQIAAVLWAVLAVAVIYAAALTAVVWTTSTWPEWPYCVIPAGALLLSIPLLLTVTGVHTYWLHPRHLPIEQQNRGIALGYYAAGPLAFLPLAALLAAGGWAAVFVGEELLGRQAEDLLMILMLVSWAPLLAIPVAMLRVMLVVARYAARREAVGLTIMGLTLPALWLALTVIFMLLVPALLGYVWLMILTLPT